MHWSHDGGVLLIRLPKECLIHEVEAHHELAVAAEWDAPGVAEVVVEAGAVEAMDTAYLQLVLAMRRSAMTRGKPFRVRNPSPSLREIADLYGLRLWPETAETSGEHSET